MQSLVTSRLDYSNGLLYGIPRSAVSILQSDKNFAARIVTKTAPRENNYNDTSFQRATLVASPYNMFCGKFFKFMFNIIICKIPISILFFTNAL